jgi:hypothetical protein
VLATSGPRSVNPFLPGSVATPYIADLVGGAEVYGLTGLNASTTPAFAGIFAVKPPEVKAALFLMDIGPSVFAQNYVGYDMLLAINLSDDALFDPVLGVDGHTSELLVQGFLNDPNFGGAGPQELGFLGAYEVYATLVPETLRGSTFTFSFDSGAQSFAATASLRVNSGAFAYQVVPEAGAVGLTLLGAAGAVVALARRRLAG